MYKWKTGKGAYFIIRIQSYDNITFKAQVYAWLNNSAGGAKFGDMCANGVIENKKAALTITSDCNENEPKAGEYGGTLEFSGEDIAGDFTGSNGFNIDEACNNVFKKISVNVLMPYDAQPIYTVAAEHSYFYQSPSEALRRRSYLIKGDTLHIIDFAENNFVLAGFTNTKGKYTQGYLMLSTLQPLLSK